MVSHSAAQATLKAIVERIERMEEEKKTISDDIRDVYAEAKGNGYDVKALAGGRVGCYQILILDERGASLGRITLPGSQLGISVLKDFNPTISEPVHSDLEGLCETLDLEFLEETFDNAEELDAAHPGSTRMAWFQSNPERGVVAVAALTVAAGLIIVALMSTLSHS